MPVYVDEMQKEANQVVCHMVADSTEELIEMATLINVNPDKIRRKGGTSEHFALGLVDRKLAVAAGAIEKTNQEMIDYVTRGKPE